MKILNNRERLGKAEIQLMSFVTKGESDFPMLHHFFSTNDAETKKEIIKQAIEKVISSRIILPIEKFKDNQQVYFGDTGYIVYKSEVIPKDLNWMFLAIELDGKTRETASLIESILTKDNISTVVKSIETLASITNPVSAAVTELSLFVAKTLTVIFKNNKDDQAGLFLASYIDKVHYPFGKRDKEDVPDMTNNMFIDYTIFSYKE